MFAAGFCVVLFIFLVAFVLLWSRAIKNFCYYRRRKPFFASIILCRTRIAFGFEVAGILLLVIKMASPGPSQDEYNNLLAQALVANTHTVSMLYQALRKEIPATLPAGIDATKIELPKTINKVPEKLFDELHTYVRRSSILLADYFGNKLPECTISNQSIRILNLEPDTELVSLEIARKSISDKSICGQFQITEGLSERLISTSKQAIGFEILGGLFLLFAAILKFLEIKEAERRATKKKSSDWFWDEDNIRK